MPEISIIIPVYNAQGFLYKCIDSVLAQNEHCIEIILVDDGSMDTSGSVCDNYSSMNSCVKVIHQQNTGVSAARNAGIAAATGKYFGFVDSDDWISPDMFERLLQEAHRTGADVVMCDATTVYTNGRTQADTITQLSGNTVLKKSDFSPSLLLEMAGSAWRCIYSKHIYSDKLRKHSLAFPLGVKFSEDRIFNLYAFGQANKVAYIKEPYYFRNMNSESAVHRFHEDYFEAYKLAASEIEKAIKAVWGGHNDLIEAYSHQFFGGALGAVCNYYYKTSLLTNTQKRLAVKELCSDEQLQEALHKARNLSKKEQWLKEKKINLLILYARLANLKHGR